MSQLNYQQTIPNTVMSLVGTGQLPVIPGTTAAGKYQNVFVLGNYAYVAGFASPGVNPEGLSLIIYNIADPTKPFVTGYIPTQTNPWHSGPSGLNGSYSLVVQNGYAYIASAATLYVVNVKNPYNPFNVSGTTVTGSPGTLYSVAMDGNYAYIATQSKGLTVVDCTNPSAPVQVYQEGGTLNKTLGVCIANGYAFTTNYQTTAPWTVRYLKIWNISNPAAPSLITTYTLPAGTKPGEVSVNGNYAYITNYNAPGVQIVDISNVNAPNYLSSMSTSGVFNVIQSAVTNTVSFSGNYAYIPSTSVVTGGVMDMYDITNKSAPILISTYTENVPGSAGFQGSFTVNNLIYVADYGPGAGLSSTLVILSTQTAVSNPIHTFETADISCQLSNVPAGASGRYALQGCDDATNPVNWSDIPGTTGFVTAPGTYLIPKTDISSQFIRFVYTNTGSGKFNINFKTLGY